MKWLQVVESKVSYAPIPAKTKKGDDTTKFLRIGIRINLADGSWWFYSFKHKSWSQHLVPVAKTTAWGSADGFHPAIVNKFSECEFNRTTAKTPIGSILAQAVTTALEDEAEKRIAA